VTPGFTEQAEGAQDFYGFSSNSSTSPRSERDLSHRPSGLDRLLHRVSTRDFVAVEAYGNAGGRTSRRGGLYAYDVAGATPLYRWLAGNFFGHLKQYFHCFAFAERGLTSEINTGCGNVQRLA
jgi:hypothetical protein